MARTKVVPTEGLLSDLEYTSVIVSYSNGIDSTGALYWAVKNFPKEKIYLLYCDTGCEYPENVSLFYKVAAFMGVKPVLLSDWLFQRGKNCKHCCLWCEYYDLCSGQIEQERQTYKARLPDGREIAIKSVPEKERQIQRRIIKKYMQKGENGNMRNFRLDDESGHQEALFSWAAYQQGRMPELEYLHHVPNGGKRDKATATALKRQGVKAGVPDIVLPAVRSTPQHYIQ